MISSFNAVLCSNGQISRESAGREHHCGGVADGGKNRSEDVDGTSARKHQRPGKRLAATGRFIYLPCDQSRYFP